MNGVTTDMLVRRDVNWGVLPIPERIMMDQNVQVEPALATLTRGCLTLRWGAVTNTGKIRRLNEDAMLAAPGVFVVADGMGGHAAGDVASKLTIEAFAEIVTGGALEISVIAQVVSDANQRVRDFADEHTLEGMGATLVGVLLVDNAGEDSLVVFNVGDARCYVLSNGKLSQLTSDHSLVQEMVDQGELHASQARSHPQRNVVTRAIGIDPSVAADFVIAPSVGSVTLLLCSDGVHGELSDDRIAELLGRSDDPQLTAVAIIDAVLEGRAADNATAVVIDVIRRDFAAGIGSQDEIEVTGPRPNAAGIETTWPKPVRMPAPSVLTIQPPPASAESTDVDEKSWPDEARGLIDVVPDSPEPAQNSGPNTLIDIVPR